MSNPHAEWFAQLEKAHVEVDHPGPEGESPYRIWLLIGLQPTSDTARIVSGRLQREIADLIATAPDVIDGAQE